MTSLLELAWFVEGVAAAKPDVPSNFVFPSEVNIIVNVVAFVTVTEVKSASTSATVVDPPSPSRSQLKL